MEEEGLFADMTGTLYTTRYEDGEDQDEDDTFGEELKKSELTLSEAVPPLEASYVRDGFEAVVRTAPKIEAVLSTWKGMVAMPIIGGLLAGGFLYLNQADKDVVPDTPTHAVTVYAEPAAGHVEVGGVTGEVGVEFEAPEGTHEFVFYGEGWQTSCEVEVNPGLATIKFHRDGSRCFKTFR
jgi:hypothetical protein